MRRTAPEVGTVELLLPQGRVVVVALDMDILGVVLVGLLALEHNPLEGVGRGLQTAGTVHEREGEVDIESLLAVWNGMMESWLLTLEQWHQLHHLASSSCTIRYTR